TSAIVGAGRIRRCRCGLATDANGGEQDNLGIADHWFDRLGFRKHDSVRQSRRHLVHEDCPDRRWREEDAGSLHGPDEQTDRPGVGWKGHLGAKNSKRNRKDQRFHRPRPTRPRNGCDSKVNRDCAARTSAPKVAVKVRTPETEMESAERKTKTDR